jgi:replicative DNA helicase
MPWDMTQTAPSRALVSGSAASTSLSAVPDALGRMRKAPQNIDAEKALLGAIFVNNEALERVTGFLRAEHFIDPLHAQIFETASKLIAAGKQATPITMRTFFENHEAIEPGLSVAKYLGQLAIQATSIINAKDYGQTIYDLSLRRQLITIGEDLVNTAFDSPVDLTPEKQISETETRLFSLAETGKFGQGFLGFNEALRNAIEMANNAYARQGGLSGISSGLTDLDGRMGGLQASDLIVLAGRPSMGKTSLVTNIAYNVASARLRSIQARPELAHDDPSHDGAGVAFFSLEMSAEQLATRILSEQAEIGSEKIRRGMIDENEFKRLVQVSQNMAQIPLYIDQMGGITIAQVAARSRKLKRQKGLGLIIVDYLQLLSGGGNSQANRVQEITQITTGLKALAKELQCPVIALSQLSRAVEQREDKRPQLSDLRESGSIEQDADVVMFVFREEYYVERTKPQEGTPEFQEWLAKMQTVSGRAEVIIGKQRHGPVGTVQLAFDGQFTRFSDLAKDQYLPDRLE